MLKGSFLKWLSGWTQGSGTAVIRYRKAGDPTVIHLRRRESWRAGGLSSCQNPKERGLTLPATGHRTF